MLTRAVQFLQRLFRSNAWPAWAVLATALIATGFGFYLSAEEVRERAQQRFEGEAERLALRIVSRLRTYEQMLRGGVSVFDTWGLVGRDEWHSYVTGLEIGKNFPGIQGIGFAVIVPPDKVAAHNARIRAEGFPSYRLHPLDDRSVYSAIIYLEPLDWRNRRALGFDMLSDPVRRAAMEHARDSGEPTMSGKVTLVQETEADVQAGFLIYVPVYRSRSVPVRQPVRREDLLGFVYAPFRAGDFMAGIVGSLQPQIRLTVFDGNELLPEQVLFDSAPEASAAVTNLTRIVPLDQLGRRWMLQFTALPGFHATIDESSSRLVLLGGGAISGLLFLLAWSVVRRNEQLRSKESEFRYLFDKNPSVMWVYDSQTYRFLAVNDAAVALYGYSREEFARMTILDIRPKEDVPRLQQLLESHPQGLRHSGEWRHRTKDGRELIVELVGHTLSFGGRAASLVVARDMTDRRRAEAALAESERRFRMMADSMPALLWLTDADGGMIFFNRPWLDHAGTALPEQLAGGWRELLHPDEAATVTAALAQAVQARRPLELQHRLRRSDGSYHWFLDRAIPRFADDGQFLGLIGVLLDITELRNAQAQLQQAQKMEAVGRLTGGIAHDFNNLLTLILGSAEALGEHRLANDEIRATAEMIATAAERGAELTKRMLAFARRQPLQPAVIDVATLVVQMEGMLRRALGEDIEIRIGRRDGLWKTLADPHQLESAVLNLAINARDAMPSGGKLTIEIANVTLDAAYAEHNDEVTPGDYVAVSVTDTGTGMPPDVVEKVFEPFFTTKGVGEGSGLGLSMVYGFAKQSGGNAKVYSEVGQGTTVKIYLPRAGEDETQEPSDAAAFGAAPGGSEVILVVEDDEMVRAFVEGQLTSLGYTVVVAPDGPTALTKLDGELNVDLLFTDVIMPGGMTGPQLAEEAGRRKPGLKVLFTSGYAESAILHQGRLQVGMHLLNKPYRRPDLARKVRQALDSASAGPNAAAISAPHTGG